MSFDPFMLRHVDGYSVNNLMAHILYIAEDAQESSFANLTLSIYIKRQLECLIVTCVNR